MLTPSPSSNLRSMTWHPKQRGPRGEKVLVALRCGFHLHEVVPPCSLSTITREQPGFQETSSWCAGEKDRLLGAHKTGFQSLWKCRINSKLGQIQSVRIKRFRRRPLGRLNHLPPSLAVPILQPESGAHAVPVTLALFLLEARGADTSRPYVNSCPKSSAEHPIDSRVSPRNLKEGSRSETQPLQFKCLILQERELCG